mmetsp:Transcript_9553/g.18628  ORF Transcript_9553/g.18628 Transcript_9553/m.18628 type:complete len:272 (-) Transcript_9553:1893-2708(-)
MTISDELCYRFHSSIPWGNCTGQRYPDAGMLRTSLLHDVPRFRPQYLSTCHTHIDISEGIASSRPTNPSESYNEGVEEKHCVYRPKMRLCWLSLLHQCFVSSLSHSEIRLTVSSPPRKRYPSLWIAVRIIVVAISLTRNGSPNAIWYSSDPRTIESGSLRRCSIARRRFPSRLSTARVKPWTVRSGHLYHMRIPFPSSSCASKLLFASTVTVAVGMSLASLAGDRLTGGTNSEPTFSRGVWMKMDDAIAGVASCGSGCGANDDDDDAPVSL